MGDASTKYLGLNVNASAFSQNDHSLSVYRSSTSAATNQRELCISSGSVELLSRTTDLRALSTNGTFIGGSGAAPTFAGISRQNSAGFDWRCGTFGNHTNASLPISVSVNDAALFAIAGGGAAFSSQRLATYHAGPALNLATLENLQETLLLEISAI
jgi:hypothetical protein